MKWQKIIGEIESQFSEFQLVSPVVDFLVIESEFRLKLPAELAELYRETNGISEVLDGEIIGELIWGVERVVQDNISMRTYPDYKNIYLPFDDLLFISDSGTGDQFGYAISENGILTTDIYAWNHEDDSRTWVAPDLETFVREWGSGRLVI